jgi:hypothetical protein
VKVLDYLRNLARKRTTEADDYDSVYWLLAPREQHTLARSLEVDFEMPPRHARGRLDLEFSSGRASANRVVVYCLPGGRASMNHC